MRQAVAVMRASCQAGQAAPQLRGMLTLTRPGSLPAGSSSAVAGSLPVSCQASGWRLLSGRERDSEVHGTGNRYLLPACSHAGLCLSRAPVHFVGCHLGERDAHPGRAGDQLRAQAGLVVNAVPSGMCAFCRRAWSVHQAFGG